MVTKYNIFSIISLFLKQDNLCSTFYSYDCTMNQFLYLFDLFNENIYQENIYKPHIHILPDEQHQYFKLTEQI